MNSIKAIYFFACISFFTSCVDKLDFSQIDDYTTTPVFNGSLFYFTMISSNFIDPATGNEITDLLADVSDFRIFEDSFFRRNARKLEFNLEIKNELDRSFVVHIDFLDDSDTVVYSFSPLSIAANNLDFKHLETIEIDTNQNVLNTTQTRVKVDMLPSSNTLNPTDTSELEFKSSGTLYLKID